MKLRNWLTGMKLALSVSAIAVLPSCAPISRDSCVNDSAEQIGYRAAMDNADRELRMREIDRTCIKFGREVDIQGYLDGFEAGTRAFCVPDNGYRWGLAGREYNGICRDPEFGMAYAEGKRVYRIEQRRRTIRDRLEEIRSSLSSIERRLDENKEMTDERRRELLRRRDDLKRERRDLQDERDSLPPT